MFVQTLTTGTVVLDLSITCLDVFTEELVGSITFPAHITQPQTTKVFHEVVFWPPDDCDGPVVHDFPFQLCLLHRIIHFGPA